MRASSVTLPKRHLSVFARADKRSYPFFYLFFSLRRYSSLPAFTGGSFGGQGSPISVLLATGPQQVHRRDRGSFLFSFACGRDSIAVASALSSDCLLWPPVYLLFSKPGRDNRGRGQRPPPPLAFRSVTTSVTAAEPGEPTAAAPWPIAMTIRDSIELTELERDLFNDLLDAARKAGLQTTLRAAGGWVRDKLMGRNSLDIDIALDNMLGREFGDRVNEYLRSHGQETHKVAVIMSNPDQSKHLETARMKVRGVWIDLVNLRSEEYAHHSRIPTMTFGTPEQDAFRRDFTINSLFYNINDGVVEDFTQKGMEDLRSGLIRTPLPPKETFLDDPLRVLRAVRFASRFGFELEDELLQAASDDEVREALGHKVSRERIGTELDGMLLGPDPIGAVRLLSRLRLFEAVFEVHPSAAPDVTDEFAAAGTELVAQYWGLVSMWHPEGFEASPDAADDDIVRRQALLAALLLPLRACWVTGVKGRPQTMSAHVVKDSLKWRNKDAEAVDTLHRVAPRLLNAYHGLLEVKGNPVEAPEATRIALGRCIRELKGLWKPGVALAAVLTTPQARLLGVDPATRLASNGDASQSQTLEPTGQIELCRCLEAAVDAWNLDGCWSWPPLMDGKAVMTVLGKTSGGPWLGKVMDAVIDWQLAHPEGNIEQCEAWVRKVAPDIIQQQQQRTRNTS